MQTFRNIYITIWFLLLYGFFYLIDNSTATTEQISLGLMVGMGLFTFRLLPILFTIGE